MMKPFNEHLPNAWKALPQAGGWVLCVYVSLMSNVIFSERPSQVTTQSKMVSPFPAVTIHCIIPPF